MNMFAYTRISTVYTFNTHNMPHNILSQENEYEHNIIHNSFLLKVYIFLNKRLLKTRALKWNFGEATDHSDFLLIHYHLPTNQLI